MFILTRLDCHSQASRQSLVDPQYMFHACKTARGSLECLQHGIGRDDFNSSINRRGKMVKSIKGLEWKPQSFFFLTLVVSRGQEDLNVDNFLRKKSVQVPICHKAKEKKPIVRKEIVAGSTKRTPGWRQRRKDLQGVGFQIWDGLFCLDEWK